MNRSIYLALLLSLTVTGCGGGGSSSGPDVQPPQAVDSDNDGVPDSTDAFPNDASESVDTDGDGIGNNADLDDDNDGVNDSDDAFPLDRSESKDTDGDGIGNNADTDDDNDGVPDEQDDLPENSEESVDTDGDGIGNNADTDDDNDGVEDQHDIFPLDPTESIDTDGDGIGNNADTDDDNDGVEDSNDAFPLDSTESVDTDGDGIGNNADTDDDNDGVEDANDAFPLDSTESVDTDGDGIGNNADTDDDNDGVEDSNDAFPLDSTESVDTDGDGIGNNADTDDDNDGIADHEDAFPFDSSEWLDTDGDGVGNNADNDDDNDGVEDSNDAFPLDNTESVDTDGDGIGNNADTDDDNDGVEDSNDAFPLDSTESVDTDGDGIGNNADEDDDGDGVNDSEDAFPLDGSETVDTDEDGIGNNADTDDDNDRLPDDYEIEHGLSPLTSNIDSDTDEDGFTDYEEYSLNSHPANKEDMPKGRLWQNHHGPASGDRFQPFKLNSAQFSVNWESRIPGSFEQSDGLYLVATEEGVYTTGENLFMFDSADGHLIKEFSVFSDSYFLWTAGNSLVTLWAGERNDFGHRQHSVFTVALDTGEVSMSSDSGAFNRNLYLASGSELYWTFYQWEIDTVYYYFKPQNLDYRYSLSLGPMRYSVDEKYAYIFKNGLYVIDLETSQPLFENVANSMVGFNRTVIGARQDLFAIGQNVADGVRNLYGINRKTGEVKWQEPVTTNVVSAAGVNHVFTVEQNELVARDSETGRLSWRKQVTEDTLNSADVVATLSHVFIASSNYTYAIDIDSGELVWTYPVGGGLALSHDQKLYIKNMQKVEKNLYLGKVISIDLKGNPLDSDGDGLPDYIDNDDDNDGVFDEQDAFPLDDTETTDTDGDGIGNNTDTDDDNDGLSDEEEIALGLNPLSRDSDGDKFDDNWEVLNGFDPLVAQTIGLDSDGDGYSDLTEYYLNTQWLNRQSMPDASAFNNERANAQLNGFIAQKVALNNLTLQWQIPLGDGSFRYTKLRGRDEKLVSISKYGAKDITLFNINTGKRVWQKHFDIWSNQFVSQGNVFISQDDVVLSHVLLEEIPEYPQPVINERGSNIRRFSFVDGSLVSKAEFSDTHMMTAEENRFYLSQHNNLQGLSTQKLTPEWSTGELNFISTKTISVDDEFAYVAEEGLGLTKIHKETGTVAAGNITNDIRNSGNVAVGFKGIAYTTAGPEGARQLIAFDKHTNAILWQTVFGNKLNMNGITVGIGEVYVIADDVIKAFDDSNGELVWQYNEFQTDDWTDYRLIATPDYLFVKDGEGVFAIDLKTRERVLSYPGVLEMIMFNGRLVMIDQQNYLVYDLGIDSDGDGMPDWFERAHGFDRAEPSDANGDKDGDGVGNLREYLLSLNPSKADSDDDGLSDSEELDVYLTDGSNPDTDGDGLLDGWEVRWGLLPLEAQALYTDSDGDGFFDREEMRQDTSPVDAQSVISTVDQATYSFEDGELPTQWQSQLGPRGELSIEMADTTDGEKALRLLNGVLKIPQWLDGNWVSFDIKSECGDDLFVSLSLDNETYTHLASESLLYQRIAGDQWHSMNFFVQRGEQSLSVKSSAASCALLFDNLRITQATIEQLDEWQYFTTDVNYHKNLLAVSLNEQEPVEVVRPYLDANLVGERSISNYRELSLFGPSTYIQSLEPFVIATLDKTQKRWVPRVLPVEHSLNTESGRSAYPKQLQLVGDNFVLLTSDHILSVADFNRNSVISKNVSSDFGQFTIGSDGDLYGHKEYKDYPVLRLRLSDLETLEQFNATQNIKAMAVKDNGELVTLEDRTGEFFYPDSLSHYDSAFSELNHASMTQEIGWPYVLSVDEQSNTWLFHHKDKVHHWLKFDESLQLIEQKTFNLNRSSTDLYMVDSPR